MIGKFSTKPWSEHPLSFGSRADVSADDVRAAVEQGLRVKRFRAELIAGAAAPAAEEVESFYNLHGHNFRRPELFRAAHIVKHVRKPEEAQPALETIRLALTDLEQGAEFGDVARRYSDCGENGGDLGEFPSGHAVPEFEREIAALEPGQRTGIFGTPFGFHIAMLIDRVPAGRAELSRVRGDIERVMVFANQREAYHRRMWELRAAAHIRRTPEAGADGGAGSAA